MAAAAEALDDAGKMAAGYKRDKGSKTAFDGNSWMDDHCTGMWFSPTDVADPELEKKLSDMLGKIENNKWSMLKGGFDELAEIAVEKAGPVAQDMATNFLLKTGAKAVIGGVLGETVVVPAVMAAWTVSDLFSTAEKLAELAGDKGKAALDALKKSTISAAKPRIFSRVTKKNHTAPMRMR